MKSILLLTILSVSCSFSAYSFTDKLENSYIDEPSQELVIGTPNFNMKRYDDFTNSILSINGIKNIEFCPEMEVFMIQYDSAVFGTSEEAFKTIENQLKSFKIFHKLGTSHAELKGYC